MAWWQHLSWHLWINNSDRTSSICVFQKSTKRGDKLANFVKGTTCGKKRLSVFASRNPTSDKCDECDRCSMLESAAIAILALSVLGRVVCHCNFRVWGWESPQIDNRPNMSVALGYGSSKLHRGLLGRWSLARLLISGCCVDKLLGKGVASSNVVHQESVYTKLEHENLFGGALDHHVRIGNGTRIAYSENVGHKFLKTKRMGRGRATVEMPTCTTWVL